MGVHVLRRVSELGPSLILAPERFDPRRRVEIDSTRCLGDLATIVTGYVTARSFPPERPVLVLDTTHAYEGFVVLRHDPVLPEAIGSTKRRLQPGDVIISRLRPYLRQVAFIDEDWFRLAPGGNEVCASTEFFVIRRREDGGTDPAALVPFLLSDPVQAALAAGQEGGHHPRFPKELLGSLCVPDGVVQDAVATAREVRRLASGMRRALRGMRGLVAETRRRMG